MVNNANSLPRIFQREARRVARPLIWDKHSVQPQVKMPSHEILGGLSGTLPPLDRLRDDEREGRQPAGRDAA